MSLTEAERIVQLKTKVIFQKQKGQKIYINWLDPWFPVVWLNKCLETRLNLRSMFIAWVGLCMNTNKA